MTRSDKRLRDMTTPEQDVIAEIEKRHARCETARGYDAGRYLEAHKDRATLLQLFKSLDAELSAANAECETLRGLLDQCRDGVQSDGRIYAQASKSPLPLAPQEQPSVTREQIAELVAREVCGVERLSDLYADKRAWTDDRGRKWDINFPYQCDVIGCADAILGLLSRPPQNAAAGQTKPFRCKARHSRSSEPQDCDYPFCSCDPAADRVFRALEEGGYTITASPQEWAAREGGMPTRADRQRQVKRFVDEAFGPDSVHQRALRFLEEAIEAYQAAGCDQAQAHRLIDFIFSRPVGDLHQELGGVGITLLALAATAGLDADEAEQCELERVLSKPIEHFRARNQAKNEAGFSAPLPGQQAQAGQRVRTDKRCSGCGAFIYSDDTPNSDGRCRIDQPNTCVWLHAPPKKDGQ